MTVEAQEAEGEAAWETGEPETRYRVPALERGLDILEQLARSDTGISRAGLAEALGCSVSQIFRMLDCLQRRRYVSVDPRNNLFSLTSKLFELSHLHPPTRRLMALSLPIMRAAAMQAHQSIHLSIFDDGQTLVLAQVDALEDSGYFVKPGTRRDVFLTASGRVLLAFQGEEERRSMLEAARRKTGDLMPEAELNKRLEIVRLQGFEENPSLQISGVHNLSFPVMGVDGRAVAAMTMPFLVRTDLQSNMDDARRILREAAEELSKLLGYATPAGGT
ncbi:MAG TPA: IclR family transcriptional regulator [Bauldia sp.]|nr:IclR family transcriptional regulator [Bauldia sp.]